MSFLKKIAEAILDALELQLELKLSQVGLEKMLDWGKKLFLITKPGMDNLFPKNWSECVKVLRTLDMKMQNSTSFVLMTPIVASMD